MICFVIALINIVAILYKKTYLNTDVEGWTSIIAAFGLLGV